MKKLEYVVSEMVGLYPVMIYSKEIKDSLVKENIDAHIYMIVSHPKIYIKDVVIKNKKLWFKLIYDNKTIDIPVSYRKDMDIILIKKKEYFDSSKLGIKIIFDGITGDKKETIEHSFYAYDVFQFHSSKIDYKVEYIGQSYGTNGDRTAEIRLSNHSTLQKILAKQSSSPIPREIQIILLNVKNVDLTNTFFGIPAPKGNMEISYSNKQLHEANVNLLEAFLINYFKPEYNMVFKDGIVPEKNHKSYKRILDESYDSFAFSFDAYEDIERVFYTDNNKIIVKNGFSEKIVVDFETANIINSDEYLYSFFNEGSE